MIEVFEYLFNRLKDKPPVTVEVNGQNYAVQQNGTLGAPIRELAPQFTKPTFKVTTLSALQAAVAAGVDKFGSEVALHVVDYRTVQLVSMQADEFGRRHVFVEATHADECPFEFDAFMLAEKFQIDFRTSFYMNDDAVKVLTVVSNLEAGSSISVADDGLSQKLEVKLGTVSKTPVTLPSEGIPLVPWRTFRDADPVESKFLLRLASVKDSIPKVALFAIDQKWRLDTQNSVAAWLKQNIPGVTVIA